MEQNDHSADHDIHPSNCTCGTKVHYYFSNLKIKREQRGMGLNMHTLVTILEFAQSYQWSPFQADTGKIDCV